MTDTKSSRRIAQVRALLHANPDGLTVAEILERIPSMYQAHLARILRAMPDSYIDRWVRGKTPGAHRAVWCVIVPPEDCPRQYRSDESIRRKRK
jgi:hypothetical protein